MQGCVYVRATTGCAKRLCDWAGRGTKPRLPSRQRLPPSFTERTQSSAGECRYSRLVSTGYSRSRDQTRG